MFNWISAFWNANSETKWFILNWFIYGAILVATTLYCYGRLDYVRSYKIESKTSSAQSTN